MKVAVAIDSWKGSLTSVEAGMAVKEGILRVDPSAEVVVRPLADGGEGTAEALVLGMGGELCCVQVTGPLGEPVICSYGIVQEENKMVCAAEEMHVSNGCAAVHGTKTAVMEMSGAAGLLLVPPEKRNPLKATTYGVGEVIKDAIEHGCRHFVVGIGGSATNDGGIGMLQALGFDMLDEKGEQVAPGAQGLSRLVSISAEHVLPQLMECTFRIACDVNNPLCGSLGASAVYGPQKGATPDMVEQMDQGLMAFAELAEACGFAADPEYPGTGAAGGAGVCFPYLYQCGFGVRSENRAG